MKKFAYTFSLLSALAVCANADVVKVPPTNTDTEGCYLIETAGELLGFAEIVNGIPADDENGIEAVAPQPSACAKLTRNISFFDGTLLNADLTGFNGGKVPEENNWTPMVNFSGKFDGQGYTISGLFYGGTNVRDASTWPEKAGLFINLGDDATTKNLRIVDSYFGASLRVGSIAAEVSGTGVTIDRCSFAGLINTLYKNARTTENQTKEYLQTNVYIGGLVGTLNQNAKLTLTSSIMMGNVLPDNSGSYGGDIQRGGVVGLVQGGSFVRIENTHGIGLVHKSNQYSITKTAISKTWDSDDRIFCAGSGSVCNKRYCNLTSESEINDIISACEREYMREYTESFGFQGVSLEYGTRDDGRKIVIAHITENDASRTDNVLQELVIPEDFPADSVDFDRPFKGNSSTIIIPFEIAAANVKNYNGEYVLLGSVESISCENDEVKVCTANATNEQSQINAHTPYLLTAFDIDESVAPVTNIPIGQTIHFHGPVVLKQNAANDSYQTPIEGTNWTLVGTYKTLVTTSKNDDDAESDYEKTSQLGNIFGFVGSEGISDGEGDNEHKFELGEFARAGHNVRTREMRAYLIYKKPQVLAKAASINRMQRAATQSIESNDETPSNIPVTFETRPIIPVTPFVDATLKPTKMVAVILPTFGNEEDEGNNDREKEVTTAIVKRIINPLNNNKMDRWQDIKGRHLNGKPTKSGTYFKNGIPVIIK